MSLWHFFALIVAPVIALDNWAAEYHLVSRTQRPVFILRKKSQLKKLASLDPASIIIVGWDFMARNVDALMEFSWKVLILDEAHFAKNPRSKRTQAVYGRHCTNTGLASKAERKFLLSGTPASNNPGELWPALRALAPWAVPGANLDYDTFCGELYSYPRQLANGAVYYQGARNTSAIREGIAPFTLRRETADVLKELPPIRWSIFTLSCSQIPQEILALEKDEAFKHMGQMLSDAQDSAFTDTPVLQGNLMEYRRLTEVAKAPGTAELVTEELEAEDKKVLIFVRYIATGDLLMQKLAAFAPLRISGGQSAAERTNAINLFQNDSKHRVMIASIQAAQTAITLHAASDVIFVSADWDPAVNDQAAKRAHRIGQTRPVFVRVMSLSGSIDLLIQNVLLRKTRQLANLIETTKHDDLKAVA